MYKRSVYNGLYLIGILMLAIAVPCANADPVEEVWKLLPSDGVQFEFFGAAVDVEGATAIVGAHSDGDNGQYSGAVYLFDTASGQQTMQLYASDANSGDQFGYSVAISGSTAVVGAPQNDDNGADSGAAYVIDVTTGQEQFKLLPNDGDIGERFGFHVAIDGDLAVIGADLDGANGAESGAAYVFDVTTGQQLHKLVADDGAAGDNFGVSVAISGTTALVGAWRDDDNERSSGSAYLFDVASGQQIHKLLPDDGAQGDEFGRSVAIDGTTALVGAPGWNGNSGVAYLFDTATGQQLHTVQRNDSGVSDSFGWAVAMQGNTALIGAHQDDENGGSSGSGYLFNVDSADQITKFWAADTAENDNFAQAVGMDGDMLIVGAQFDDDNGSNSGSAYLFNVSIDCLTLTVDNLVAGQQAMFTISGGTPGVGVVTVYGLQPGQTVVSNVFNYCATFGINGVNQSRVLGGLNRTFDANGEVSFGVNIPGNASGVDVLFQSAGRGTCPDECMSNLVEATVQ